MKIRCITTTILALVLNASGATPLPGKGTPEIAIRDGKGTHLVSKTDTIYLGTSPLGGLKLYQTLTIKNLGNAPLRNIEIKLSGGDAGKFAFSQAGKRILSSGETAKFTIRFKSGTNGMAAARVKVFSSDSDENPFVIRLVGWGKGIDP